MAGIPDVGPHMKLVREAANNSVKVFGQALFADAGLDIGSKQIGKDLLHDLTLLYSDYGCAALETFYHQLRDDRARFIALSDAKPIGSDAPYYEREFETDSDSDESEDLDETKEADEQESDDSEFEEEDAA